MPGTPTFVPEPSLPLPSSIQHVCAPVASPPLSGNATHWSPAFFPSSSAYHKLHPFNWLRAPSAELGRDHVRLPVSHLHAIGNRCRGRRVCISMDELEGKGNHHVHERGVWFYYARGCTDLHYDVGRTLMARNKVDAALRLAALAQHRNLSAAPPDCNLAPRGSDCNLGQRLRLHAYMHAYTHTCIHACMHAYIHRSAAPEAQIAISPEAQIARFLRQGPLGNGSVHLKARYARTYVRT